MAPKLSNTETAGSAKKMVEEGIKRFPPMENELQWKLPSRTKPVKMLFSDPDP